MTDDFDDEPVSAEVEKVARHLMAADGKRWEDFDFSPQRSHTHNEYIKRAEAAIAAVDAARPRR